MDEKQTFSAVIGSGSFLCASDEDAQKCMEFIQENNKQSRLSLLTELEGVIEGNRKVITAWFRRYGQTPAGVNKEYVLMENWIKNCEDIGYNEAISALSQKIKQYT